MLQFYRTGYHRLRWPPRVAVARVFCRAPVVVGRRYFGTVKERCQARQL